MPKAWSAKDDSVQALRNRARQLWIRGRPRKSQLVASIRRAK